MKKITCTNSICEATFYFDEQRYPNATEVKCPKCKNIQPLKKEIPPKQAAAAADFSWLKQDLTPPAPQKEDFFGRNSPRKEPAPPPEKPKPPVPIQMSPPMDYEEDFFGRRPVLKEPVPTPTPLSAPQLQPISSLIVGDWASQRAFPLKAGRNFIGRRADNDIVLDQDEHISRRHAVIEVAALPNGNWRYILYDIGYLGEAQSKNGVHVGSRRLNSLDQLQLTTHSTFQLGDTKCMLK
jgi:phage FluMu protein Com